MRTTSLLAGVAGEYLWPQNLFAPLLVFVLLVAAGRGAIVTAIEQVFQRVTKGGAT